MPLLLNEPMLAAWVATHFCSCCSTIPSSVESPIRGRVVEETNEARLELPVKSVAAEDWLVAFTVSLRARVHTVLDVGWVFTVEKGHNARLVILFIVDQLEEADVRVLNWHR